MFSSANTFTVDTTPPMVSLTSPTNGSYTNDVQPSFNGTAGMQPGDQATVSVDVYSGASASGSPLETLTGQAGPDGSYSVQPSSPLAQGTYTAQAQQSDAAGNVGVSSANTFTVDTTPPVVSLTAPADDSYTNNTVPSFAGTAGTQPGDQATVTVDVYSGSSASGSPVQRLTVQAGRVARIRCRHPLR